MTLERKWHANISKRHIVLEWTCGILMAEDKEQNTAASASTRIMGTTNPPRCRTRESSCAIRLNLRDGTSARNGGDTVRRGGGKKGEFNWGSFLPFGGLAVVPDRCLAVQMRTDWIISPRSCVCIDDSRPAKCEFA